MHGQNHFTVGNRTLYRCEMLRSVAERYIVLQCVEICKFFVFPGLLSVAVLR